MDPIDLIRDKFSQDCTVDTVLLRLCGALRKEL